MVTEFNDIMATLPLKKNIYSGGSSVGNVTGSKTRHIRSGSGTNSDCQRETIFPGENDRNVKLTVHTPLGPRLGIREAIHPLAHRIHAVIT
jgi:hypothetical protein